MNEKLNRLIDAEVGEDRGQMLPGGIEAGWEVTAETMAPLSIRRAGGALALSLALVCLPLGGSRAQELEPRQYTNVPIGMNFLALGYAASEGAVLVDPSVQLDNLKVETESPVAGYARALSLGGLSAKIDGGIGHACLSGSAVFEGQHVERSFCGLTDAKTRLSVNFIGAPALRAREFASYRQDLVVGASLQLGVPVGEYDASKLVNVGTNRWSAKTTVEAVGSGIGFGIPTALLVDGGLYFLYTSGVLKGLLGSAKASSNT